MELEAALAAAIFLPSKLGKKLVVVWLMVPDDPKMLGWQVRPRPVEQLDLYAVEGTENISPAKEEDSTSTGTFWKTLPSART